ncbi:hypothetical protein FGE12_07970 [Aggregicoccus sp. 17bor-14]|uniref:anti-sigma factor family protein n=1 Tax=Myxococcaceae TaxID=31 RepID=UPI00129D0EEC|nr:MULTISPECIES: zf-HC2 domain-containing protein [Myxococcaceae]MBF5042333.1 zf-HC2 domain-containing protein [Simulacricoccus sp. 17bor-14]MRI88106.1 hypothetical protein [Aggregicoccus sp. 17bor-14]
MSCQDTQAHEALEALFLGTLEPGAHARLREHVAACAECRARYDAQGRVEQVLERRALPRAREAGLEHALMQRLAQQQPRPQPAPARAPWRMPTWLRVAVPVVACAGLAMFVVLPRLQQRSEWGARGGAAVSTWGVRAFCVSPQGQVLAEAAPGGTLRCAVGNSLQLSYTAPEAARLSIVGESPEPLQFFPQEGGEREVPAGTDVPLSFSTPVTAQWLTGPLQVHARFVGADGRERADTRFTLEP